MLAIAVTLPPLKSPTKNFRDCLGHDEGAWYDRCMTNNNITQELIDEIDERVQGRDVERLFDTFIENLTDTLIDEFDIEGDDEVNAALDYIVQATMLRFNYRLIE